LNMKRHEIIYLSDKTLSYFFCIVYTNNGKVLQLRVGGVPVKAMHLTKATFKEFKKQSRFIVEDDPDYVDSNEFIKTMVEKNDHCIQNSLTVYIPPKKEEFMIIIKEVLYAKSKI